MTTDEQITALREFVETVRATQDHADGGKLWCPCCDAAMLLTKLDADDEASDDKS